MPTRIVVSDFLEPQGDFTKRLQSECASVRKIDMTKASESDSSRRVGPGRRIGHSAQIEGVQVSEGCKHHAGLRLHPVIWPPVFGAVIKHGEFHRAVDTVYQSDDFCMTLTSQ